MEKSVPKNHKGHHWGNTGLSFFFMKPYVRLDARPRIVTPEQAARPYPDKKTNHRPSHRWFAEFVVHYGKEKKTNVEYLLGRTNVATDDDTNDLSRRVLERC